MRQLWISVPAGKGNRVVDLAKRHQGVNLLSFQAQDQDRDLDVVVLHVSNNNVGSIFEEMKSFDDANIILHPQDVYPFSKPENDVDDQITNVTHRSPLEVWLNGIQSVGSWTGFLGYAVAASVIVWVGMFTNTIFLLVGAMMVAPFAGPAMNFAMATASGDVSLMKRNLIRYFLSLSITILVALLLSLVFQQRGITNTMVDTSQISFVAVLLPLVAGAIGAHNLSQAGNNSFVPGAAVGILVAASLAPPAGLIGMAVAIGRWDLAQNGAFLLLMQLFGINLAGALVFSFYGQKPGSVVIREPKSKARWISIAASALLLAGMLAWQFSSTPALQRSSRAQRIGSVVQQFIRDHPLVDLVEVNIRFPLPRIEQQDTLLGTVFVERKPGVDLPQAQLEEQLTLEIQRAILDQGFQVTPLISVTVLDGADP
jgi:uncharacterized hydrophobic protein (TIGR00271 family)